MLKARTAIIFSSLLFLFSAMALHAEAPPKSAMALAGSVSDEQGQPLVGAVVSVFGSNPSQGARIAVTDEEGEFELEGMPPGMYRLRAYLSGFLPSAYAKVILEEGMEQVSTVLMSLAALEGTTQPSGGSSAPVEEIPESDSQRTLAELRWLLAHGDRNVLKSEEWVVPARAALSIEQQVLTADPSFAFSGEFGVRAASYDQGLDEFPGAGAGLDARLAFARLFIPTSHENHWLVSAQLLESALSSWAGRAEYARRDIEGHELTAGVTYGNYLYGDIEEFRPPEAALSHRETGQRSMEWFGSIYASDRFDLGAASISAGLGFEYFGFLSRGGYTSPRIEVAYPFGNHGRTILRGSVDYRILAPGAEDIGLLSRVAYSDVYGPTDARSSLHAERTARIQMGVEHEISHDTRIGLRVFQEDAGDQLVKLYTTHPLDGIGQFVVDNQGDFRTRGVGIKLSQSFGATVGSVGYTFGMGRAVASGIPAAIDAPPELSDEEIHDITTAVATSIERTRTRLQAAYRFISHPRFAAGQEGFAPGTSLDSRFNIQVFQLLPFVGWNGTSWELMVAVRNLFYEDIESVSILDEIAVIDAPRRVVGGVTVRF